MEKGEKEGGRVKKGEKEGGRVKKGEKERGRVKKEKRGEGGWESRKGRREGGEGEKGYSIKQCAVLSTRLLLGILYTYSRTIGVKSQGRFMQP